MCTVRFTEFGHMQTMSVAAVRLAAHVVDDDDSDEEGGHEAFCAMCRQLKNLTRHHLIPRTMHAKYLQKGFTRFQLAKTLGICRACHNVVHQAASEPDLASTYNTLEALLTLEPIQSWLSYAKRY